MVLTNPPCIIHSLGNVEITSENGLINHNSEVNFGHSNDSFLANIKSLKGSLNANDLLVYDGSNISAVPSSDFATSSDIQGIQNDYLLATNQVVKNVITDDHLTLNGGDLALNLSDYLTSTQISENYTSLTMGNGLDTRVSTLEGDHVSVEQFNTLNSTVQGLPLGITAGAQYIQSVQSSSVLSVNGSELDIDLTAYKTDSENENKYAQKTASGNLDMNAHNINNIVNLGFYSNAGHNGSIQSDNDGYITIASQANVNIVGQNIDMYGTTRHHDSDVYGINVLGAVKMVAPEIQIQSENNYSLTADTDTDTSLKYGPNTVITSGNLNTYLDTSGLAPLNNASFTGITTVQELDFAVTGYAKFNKKAYYIPMTTLPQNGAVFEYFCDNTRTQSFIVKAHISGAVRGVIELQKMYEGIGNSNMTEVSEATTLNLTGNLNGDEVDIVSSTGGTDHLGHSQKLVFTLPPYACAVISVEYCELPTPSS